MKFRVRPKTFTRADLLEQIPLATANEMDDMPVYGNQPRVRLISQRSQWQEVEIRAHSWQEINIPGFWEMLDTAIDSFLDRTERVDLKLEDHTPWAKLGKKWHYMDKGFPAGKKVAWDFDVLEALQGVLEETAEGGEFLWNDQQFVNFMLPESKEPWAAIQTKKADGVWLQLRGPGDTFSPDQIADIAEDASVETDDNCETIRMKFKDTDQVNSPELKGFLAEHLANVNAVKI